MCFICFKSFFDFNDLYCVRYCILQLLPFLILQLYIGPSEVHALPLGVAMKSSGHYLIFSSSSLFLFWATYLSLLPYETKKTKFEGTSTLQELKTCGTWYLDLGQVTRLAWTWGHGLARISTAVSRTCELLLVCEKHSQRVNKHLKWVWTLSNIIIKGVTMLMWPIYL